MASRTLSPLIVSVVVFPLCLSRRGLPRVRVEQKGTNSEGDVVSYSASSILRTLGYLWDFEPFTPRVGGAASFEHLIGDKRSVMILLLSCRSLTPSRLRSKVKISWDGPVDLDIYDLEMLIDETVFNGNIDQARDVLCKEDPKLISIWR